MSEDTRVTGRITIEPPITWAELSNPAWTHTRPLRSDADAVVEVKAEEVDTPEGVLSKRTGVAIVAERMNQSAYYLTEHVQGIVSHFRQAPDGTLREFAGYLECVWAGGEETWRVVVRGGHAETVKPTVVWPGEETPAEAAVRRVRELCDFAESRAEDEIEDPTPIPGWTTLIRRALEGGAS